MLNRRDFICSSSLPKITGLVARLYKMAAGMVLWFIYKTVLRPQTYFLMLLTVIVLYAVALKSKLHVLLSCEKSLNWNEICLVSCECSGNTNTSLCRIIKSIDISDLSTHAAKQNCPWQKNLIYCKPCI